MAQWYYHSGGKRFGPYGEEEMLQLTKGGKLKPSDSVWNETMGDKWVPASSVPVFFSPQPQSDAPAGSAQSPVMQYLGASEESRRAREKEKKPAAKYAKLAIVVAVLGAAFFGYRQFGAGGGARGARIDSLVAAGGIHLGSGPRIWVHLEFIEPPETGDAKDVKLVLSSDCFIGDMTFDWDAIAKGTTVPVAEGSLRRKKSEGVSPGKPPRLNYVFGNSFAVPLSNIQKTMDLDSRLKVKAELYWGGKRMHSKKCSVRNWYVRG